MRRIVFDKCGEPEDVLYLTEVEEQQPGQGEVLININLRPINPADIAFVRGLYVLPEAYPACPGMEAVGTVEATGEGVKDINIGSRYLVHAFVVPGLRKWSCR